MKNEILTPKEIKEKFPQIPWSSAEIGLLLSMGLIKGKKRQRVAYIHVNSLLNLIEVRNNIIEETKTRI